MSASQEQLIQRSQAGDRTATEQLVVDNSGLIWSVARRYFGRGIDPDDLYQLGCVGFLKAMQGFDEQYGTCFSTYAVPKISGEIRRFLRDDGAVKVSRSMKERAQGIRTARTRLEQTLGREPTLEEIAEELNLPIEKIIEANRTAADTLSLDTPVGDEEDTTIGSFVEDDNTPGPADATSNTLLAEALSEILNTLTEREADVLRLRFGMYDGKTHTLEEVGQIFGVTRERIRQIENKAIRKLRHPSRAKKIRDFYC